MPDRFQDLIATARDLCATLDHTGTITYISPAVQTTLGLLQTEVRGSVLWELVHPNDVVAVHAAFQDVMSQGGRRLLEFEMLDVNGRWHRFDTLLTALESTGEPAIGMVATDVTERRHLEARLRDLDEQLQQAQKMEIVGRLASGVAHDFGNLLTIIIGSSGRLLDGLSDLPALRAQAESIQVSAERAAGLVRRLLRFGRQKGEGPAILDLNVVVGEAAQLLSNLIGEHIEVQVIKADAIWPVKADRTQIDQILLNLAVNARDAMLLSGGRLTFETRNVASATRDGRDVGPSVTVSISDTGVGMDESTLARAFEPFFTTKAIGEGTGLGLANVYDIVRQHDGWTALTSVPGQGTTVTFGLPRVYETPAVGPHMPSPPVGGSETVLVVEDEEGVRTLVRDFLELAGYQVLEATMPSEAERICRERNGDIALLVTDVVMPEMSGLELSARLRLARPGLRVMYMSGFPEPTVGPDGAASPGTHFVSKPFDRQGLLRAVRGALDAPPEPR